MLLDDLKKQYLDSGEMDALLAGHDISMISDFLDNWNVMKKFQQSFYADGLPKTVLCGINPGRHGAGKTGILFIDKDVVRPRVDSNIQAHYYFIVKSKYV